jgi:hypothetical protein
MGAPGHPRAPPRGARRPCRGRWTACGATAFPSPPTRDPADRPTLHPSTYPAPNALPCSPPGSPPGLPGHPGPLPSAPAGRRRPLTPGKAPGKRSPGETAPLNNDLRFTYPAPRRGPPSRLLACPPGGRLPSPRLARFRGHFRLSAKFGPPAQGRPAYPAPPSRRPVRGQPGPGRPDVRPGQTSPSRGTITLRPTLHPPPERTTI